METQLVSSGVPYLTIPPSYVRPEPERPKLSQVEDYHNAPLIDLGCDDRDFMVQQIDQACKQYGFFQVINHGVPTEIVEKMLEASNEFFRLPMEEKLKLYSNDPSKTVRLSTSSNLHREKIHNWRDYLRLHCHPLDKYVEEWPNNPPSFKVIRQLGLKLQELISESLGLEKDFINKSLGEQGQHMAINYYPQCPEPELTFGLPAHTDPNTLTILLQDVQVTGLQLLKDGKWMNVKPYPNAFVVNIGDQLQALSNSKYKSTWHRAVVNAHRARISVASFLCPSHSALIKAPKELIEEGSQALYRDFTYAEYFDKFWTRNLDQGHCLELFKNL